MKTCQIKKQSHLHVNFQWNFLHFWATRIHYYSWKNRIHVLEYYGRTQCNSCALCKMIKSFISFFFSTTFARISSEGCQCLASYQGKTLDLVTFIQLSTKVHCNSWTPHEILKFFCAIDLFTYSISPTLEYQIKTPPRLFIWKQK